MYQLRISKCGFPNVALHLPTRSNLLGRNIRNLGMRMGRLHRCHTCIPDPQDNHLHPNHENRYRCRLVPNHLLLLQQTMQVSKLAVGN